MSQPATAATPIEPVNATSSANEVSQDAPSPRSKGTSPMEDRLYDVMGAINQKYGGDPNEFASLSQITSKVEAEAKGKAKPEAKQQPKEASGTHAVGAVSKEQQVAPKQPMGSGLADDQGKEHRDDQLREEGASEEQQQPKPIQKEKFKVGEQEFELDPDQVKRFAQKGIHYEKKAVDFTKRENEIQSREAAIQQAEQQKQAFFEALKNDPGAVLEQLYGADVFDKMKPWAAQKVQREMEYEQNPQLREIEQERTARQAAEAQLQAFHQQQYEAQVSQQAEQFQGQLSETIMKALQEEGIPKTDFTAAEMAGHISRAVARNIEYTPQQLAQIVKQDNTVRVGAMTAGLVSQIEEARKNNDHDAVVKVGEQAVQIFGEPLMYAMAKYHLAKMQRQQPNQPKKILDAPKLRDTPPTRKPYMSEDEARAKRKQIVAAMERGEQVPENIWDTF